ncbi:MAG TPA: lipopolysaccharide kinase InaA family protein [Candidatus Binatia bacterium]|nr:lipopolysaccharide kinase InaA family protein [Candidatus Binatia bacterium]
MRNLDTDETSINFPDLFYQKECKTIKLEKKIRVVRMLLHIGRAIKSVYVKQQNVLSFGHRLASLFCASAALRSLSGAATLLQEGYAIARPVAAVEYRRRGVLITSFYVSEEITGAKTITDYWREDILARKGTEGQVRRRRALRKLAGLFKSLHERRIYHNDLKAANILALDKGPADEEILNLVDLQGARKCYYLSRRRRIKNLAQINRTLGNHLTAKEKLTFLQEYVGDGIFTRRKRRHLVRRILEETNHQMTREKLRHRPTENHALFEIASAAHGFGKNKCGCSTAG